MFVHYGGECETYTLAKSTAVSFVKNVGSCIKAAGRFNFKTAGMHVDVMPRLSLVRNVL
jgi:hypothetical protein